MPETDSIPPSITDATTDLVLVNLGTPSSPTTGDVRRFLREFLSDPKVIDSPAPLRWALVNLIIAPFRSPRSSRQYQQIWTQQGSPLLVAGRELCAALQRRLGPGYRCHLAMRYGDPSLRQLLRRLRGERLSRLLLLPLFPQYASATSGSIAELVLTELAGWKRVPVLNVLGDFCDQPGFVRAWAAVAEPLWSNDWDYVLFSYHGLPERQLEGICGRSDCRRGICPENGERACYRAACWRTSRAIAAALGLSQERWSISFQSRLGGGWLSPFTDEAIPLLAQQGVRRLLVFSPSFVADCLETSYEIAVEGGRLFRAAGGRELQLVPSLNAHSVWVDFLADYAQSTA